MFYGVLNTPPTYPGNKIIFKFSNKKQWSNVATSVKVNNKGTGTTSMTSVQRLRGCFEQWSRSVFFHLLVQSQQWKHQKNVWNLFKVNNKDNSLTSMAWFWCLYCQLWIGFTNVSCVFIVDFEQVNAGLFTVNLKSMRSNIILFFRNSSLEVFCKKAVLKIFWKVIEKGTRITFIEVIQGSLFLTFNII